MNHLLEDDGVNVLAKHIQQEPVTHLGLLDDDVDALLLDQAEPDVEEVCPHPGREDDHGPVDAHQRGEEHEQDHPEPEKDVDLLIDNVDGQDAERVVLFNLAGRTKFVEGALCHARKDVDHGVQSVLLVALGKGNHL